MQKGLFARTHYTVSAGDAQARCDEGSWIPPWRSNVNSGALMFQETTNRDSRHLQFSLKAREGSALFLCTAISTCTTPHVVNAPLEENPGIAMFSVIKLFAHPATQKHTRAYTRTNFRIQTYLTQKAEDQTTIPCQKSPRAKEEKASGTSG